MPYTRKTKDEYDLEGLYAGRWEVLTCEETFDFARARRKEYRENEGGTYRIVKHRVKLTQLLGA